MGFYEALLQKLNSDYARVKRWLTQCEQWESRLKNAKSIVDVVLHGPASIPEYEKQLRKLDGQRRHLWRREAALLVGHMAMDDSFVSDLSEEELRCIQEHKQSANLRPILVALQRRVATRQLQALQDQYRRALWNIDEYIAAVSLYEDSEDRLLNLSRQREAVEERLAEVKQALARLQGEDKEPEPSG